MISGTFYQRMEIKNEFRWGNMSPHEVLVELRHKGDVLLKNCSDNFYY
jgi:hypothetical protein